MSKYRYGKRTSTVTSVQFVREEIQQSDDSEELQDKVNDAWTALVNLRNELSNVEDAVDDVRTKLSEAEEALQEVDYLV